MSFRLPNMFSLFTLVLASSTVAIVAQAANAEPTKVTKLHTTTDMLHAPCHTADTDMHARKLTNSFLSPTWSEPSWVLVGAPTTTPIPPSTTPAAGTYAKHTELTLDMIVVIVVISTIGGGLILFGLIGCIIKACIHRSGEAAGKGKGKDKAHSRRKRAADIEMTAGLTAHAGPVGGSSAPRRFEEMETVSLVSRNESEPSGVRTPESAYRRQMPYLTGELEWEPITKMKQAYSKPVSR